MTDHVIHHLGPLDVPGLAPRKVRVYVPPRDRGGPPSPVLYMFDGQNVFDDEPSYAGGWHLHKASCALAKKHKRAPVIVAIDHGGAARIHELSPWPGERGGGGADALVDWIGSSLAPRIRGEFHCSSEPREVGIGGSSMGGLCAVYAHFRRPEHFGLVLSMSPSLFMGRGKIFEYVASRSKPWTSRVYLDAGGLEGGGGMLRLAQKLANDLQGRGWDDGTLRWVPVKRGTHSEKAWRRRAPGALAWLFVPGAGGKGRKR
jgi:predicted alpha/beta superfamily hydrolase